MIEIDVENIEMALLAMEIWLDSPHDGHSRDKMLSALGKFRVILVKADCEVPEFRERHICLIGGKPTPSKGSGGSVFQSERGNIRLFWQDLKRWIRG
jgi:hypothetical protein